MNAVSDAISVFHLTDYMVLTSIYCRLHVGLCLRCFSEGVGWDLKLNAIGLEPRHLSSTSRYSFQSIIIYPWVYIIIHIHGSKYCYRKKIFVTAVRLFITSIRLPTLELKI